MPIMSAMTPSKTKHDFPITVDKNVMSGTPVFRGTRVPVQTIFEYLIDGHTLDRFLASFPTVNREDAIAVLQTATQYLAAGASKP